MKILVESHEDLLKKYTEKLPKEFFVIPWRNSRKCNFFGATPGVIPAGTSGYALKLNGIIAKSKISGNIPAGFS